MKTLFNALALTILGAACIAAEVVPESKFSPFKCEKFGNFSHPKVCESFVHCDSNLTAYEIKCPKCEDPVKCPAPSGRLHFSPESNACVSAPDAKCPPRDECDTECMQQGFCECYDTCRSDNSSSLGGRWQRGIYCDQGLFWNPDGNNGIHGGSCDFWDNLSPEVQEAYRNDTICPTPDPPCFWDADPKCDNKYFYLPEHSKNMNYLLHLECPVSPHGVQLCWNQAKSACGLKCSHNPPLICKDGKDNDDEVSSTTVKSFRYFH